MISDGWKIADDGKWVTRDQLSVSDRVPSRGFCFPGKHTLENQLCVSDRVPSRGFCFLGKQTLRKRLSISESDAGVLDWGRCLGPVRKTGEGGLTQRWHPLIPQKGLTPSVGGVGPSAWNM